MAKQVTLRRWELQWVREYVTLEVPDDLEWSDEYNVDDYPVMECHSGEDDGGLVDAERWEVVS